MPGESWAAAEFGAPAIGGEVVFQPWIHDGVVAAAEDGTAFRPTGTVATAVGGGGVALRVTGTVATAFGAEAVGDGVNFASSDLVAIATRFDC